MNAPPRFESFILYDGEKKIEVRKEVNVSGMCFFFFHETTVIYSELLKTKLKTPRFSR